MRMHVSYSRCRSAGTRRKEYGREGNCVLLETFSRSFYLTSLCPHMPPHSHALVSLLEIARSFLFFVVAKRICMYTNVVGYIFCGIV